MRIYSNSFFHFFKDFEILIGIINDGFNVCFCNEEIYSEQKEEPRCIRIPMVCFCDIPLSFVQQNNYGKFCIGMSRKWGIHKQLQPVLYYPNNKDCLSTQLIMTATKNYLEHPENPNGYAILGCAKPMYKLKNDDPKKSKNNYIEREWRKVYKSYNKNKWKSEIKYQKYKDSSTSSLRKPKVGTLTFSVDDIDCIVLGKKYVNEFIKYIESSELTQIGGLKVEGDLRKTKDLLLSKIIQYESLASNM